MANTVNSPNMLLPVPVVGVDPGPQYATDINSCLSVIDSHTHAAGSGVQITPDGININNDLTFNLSYSATNIKKVVFASQISALTGTNFASVIGGNLYFNDSSGNQIAITAGGGVAGSPGSIGSLTPPAAATYSAGSKTFTWTADSAKAAAMDNGAVTIRETNVASAKGITLASPTALAADYQLTLPAALPASNQYLTSSSAGVLSFSTADNIGSAMTSVGSNAISSVRTRSTGTSVGVGGVAVSASCGSFSTSSGSPTDVTNLSVTITTSGCPVEIRLISDNTGSNAQMGITGNAGLSTCLSNFYFFRDGSQIAQTSVEYTQTITSGQLTSMFVPSTSFSHSDIGVNGTPGTYVYKMVVTKLSGNSAQVANTKLVAYELS